MKNGKLYSIMFPVWFLLVFPITWLVILPVNLVIDTIILIAGFKYFKVAKAYETFKKVILKVWLLGLLANVLGSLVLLLTGLLPNASQVSLYNAIVNKVAWNPLASTGSIIITVLAIVISMLLLYNFNYKISFKKVGLDKKKAQKLAALMAIITAPWILLFPSNLLFNKTDVASTVILDDTAVNEAKSLEIRDALNNLEVSIYIDGGVYDCKDLKLSVNCNVATTDDNKLNEYKTLFESETTDELLNKNAERLFSQISYINDIVFQVSDSKTYAFSRSDM